MIADKDALVREMKAYFGDDARRIDHAGRVTAFAEQLLEREKGDYSIVIGAAVLHDIGIPLAIEKYGSPGARYQEIEGPPVAREILTGLGFEEGQVEEICEIIGNHHSPGKIDTTNFKILYDADWLVNIEHEYNITDKEKLSSAIDKVFLTGSGRALARQTYLPDA